MLARMMDEATGREWRDWLPETVANFAGLSEADVQQRDKLMAAQVGLTNPDAFEIWHCFLACVTAFNHRRASFQWLDKPSIMELAWGCTALNQLNPNATYGPDVNRFISTVMIHDGLTFFPWVGGEGIVLGDSEQPWTHGLLDAGYVSGLGTKVKKIWQAGELQDLEPSDVEPTDPLHNQLAAIVCAQTYIRAQQLESPAKVRA